jgi:hypothetical protein
MKFKILCIFVLCICSLWSRIIVQDDLTKVYNVSVGESGNGTIQLHNPTDTSINIRVSSADYLYNANNETFFLEPGKYVRSNADWIRFPQTLTVRPFQTATLPFTYYVPNDRELYGSYWSVLFIEQEADFFIDEVDDLVLNLRYSVQIVHNIIGTGRVDLSFQDVRFNRDNLTIAIKNTGSNWFESNIKVDIYDERAFLIGSYLKPRVRIYPDLDLQVTIPFTPLFGNEYYAVIVVDCGNNQIFGHQVSFHMR